MIPFLKHVAAVILLVPLYGMAQTPDTTYTLIGDTLFSNANYKIAVGQPLIIGNASGEEGRYQTIMFKSGASWPLLLFRDAEIRQNYEYQLDPTAREKDKVKGILAPGDTLIVRKIKRFGGRRSGRYRYVVTMGQKQGIVAVNFRCDISYAIRLGEVRVPVE